ncbi:hypothetical protein [Anaerovorax sp. IOR16]|uniref:hypothetical protein n=1 Tax=Anaerovorax sp. IOR16 TaxID=2773458 RepID=UPI0019D114C4|nr:hypothetical protein [Anaerovorax sp. IOR16]
MKKIMAVLLALVMVMGAMTGCGSTTSTTEEGSSYNKEYNRENMITISGQEVSVKDNENAFVDKALGFGFVNPESWKSIDEECMDMMVGGPSQVYIGYLSSEVVAQVMFLKEI